MPTYLLAMLNHETRGAITRASRKQCRSADDQITAIRAARALRVLRQLAGAASAAGVLSPRSACSSSMICAAVRAARGVNAHTGLSEGREVAAHGNGILAVRIVLGLHIRHPGSVRLHEEGTVGVQT